MRWRNTTGSLTSCCARCGNIVAHEKGTHKALLSIEKKPSKMKNDEWNNIDFHAKAMIILCLSDKLLYNVMNEETIAGLWYRLESLYMTKSLSNKLFMKKQFYSLQMKEGMLIFYNISMVLIEF